MQAPDCPRATAEWSKQQADVASHSLSPGARHRAARDFVKRYPDDPEGCIRPLVVGEIAKLEAGLIHLVVGGRPEAAQRVMMCNSVDSLSQHCSGPDLDDAALSRQGEAVVRIRPGEKLRIKIDSAIGLELQAVFSHPMGQGVLQALGTSKRFRLQKPEGLVIAIFRSRNQNPEFAFRKVLWRFALR